jgi:hypothetical protein
LTGALISFNASATDSYLCVADLTTGFSFDNARKKWVSADFRSEKKLVIARAKQKPYAWEVKEAGDSRPGATCGQDFNEAGNLFCSGIFDIRFNSRKLKFLYVYPIGYGATTIRDGVPKAPTPRAP